MQTRLVDFIYLQILDMLTTIAFLWHGVQEANPLVNAAIRVTDHPLGGLLLIKTIAVTVAFACWRTGRHRLLARANIFFCLLVIWNIVAILMQRSHI